MIQIRKMPQIAPEPLAPVLIAKGEKLAITAGEETKVYDFSALEIGQFLETPDGYLVSVWREEENIHADVLWPISADAPEEERFPPPETLEEATKLPKGEKVDLSFLWPQKPEPSPVEKLSALAFQAALLTDRAAESPAISDEILLLSTELIDYPRYAVNTAYKKGEIIQQDGFFYEVLSDHLSLEGWPVDATPTVYRRIELRAAGSLEDPIPYPEGGSSMNVENGKYYSYKGKIYLAKADIPNCVWPPDTAIWQWEAV